MSSEVVPLWRETEGASGRETELTLLLREREEGRSAARARFVFVRGPEGVGKTHLFGLLRRALAARGVPVFEGSSAREVRRPFGLFVSLFEQLLSHATHMGAPGAQLASISRALAPVLDRREGGALGGESARMALCDAAFELFSLVGRERPVFLFPDLEVADAASLELFRYLAAVVTSPESRAEGLFVASFRDEAEPPAPLVDVLARVTARTLSLAGLDVEGIRTYLARQDVAQRLFETTAGIPDRLEALLTRPASVAVDLFLRRAERLPERTRVTLELLAVATEALALESVAAAVDEVSPGAPVAAALVDGLARQHLLTVRMVGGRPVYRLQREAERRALLESLSAERTRELQRVLAVLHAEAGDFQLAAELLFEAEDGAKAAGLALIAADALVGSGAHEAAEALFRRALPFLSDEDRRRTHFKLSEVLAIQGEYRAALRQLGLSRDRARRPEDTALHAHRAARLLTRIGRLSFAERALTIARAAAEAEIAAQTQSARLRTTARATAQAESAEGTQPDRGLSTARAAAQAEIAADASATLVELRLLRGDADGALALAAATLPTIADRPVASLVVQNVVGKAYLWKGDLARAETAFAELQERAEREDQPALAARALLNRGVVAGRQGDREAAVRCYQAILNSTEPPLRAHALANLGSLHAETGEFELALDHLSRALQAFSRLSSHREMAHVASNLARLQQFLGDLDRAVELSEHVQRLSREIGEPYLAASARLNLGAVAIERRELADAARLLDEAREGFERVGNDGYAGLAAALKARAHLLAGERAQASVELGRRVVEKGVAAQAACALEVELVRAELSLALGDLLEAGKATGRAREALLGKPDLEGPFRVYLLAGKLRAAVGDPSGAQAEFSRSARLLEELVARVAPARRQAFLSVSRRSEVLSLAENELRLPRTLARSPAAPTASLAAPGLVGHSAALAKVVRQLDPIARSGTTVLIRGESGTGKEVLADAIHSLSARREMPFVKVNCAAMVEELLLSELFGHEKGAFTGAVRERKGRFELADGGTLFLDEIGDISPKCQVALLRVLQEREFERVGGTRTLKVDVRVICATNRDLEQLIAEGRFRQDLYYRLKGVMLELPALRERLEDLPLLAQHILGKVARERGEPQKQLTADALELLRAHDWPGNVRELENVLASSAIFADGDFINPAAFEHIDELAVPRAEVFAARVVAEPGPSVLAARSEAGAQGGSVGGGPLDYYELARTRGLSLRELQEEMEFQCIRRALEDATGNISEAARLLGMKRSRLSQIVNADPRLKELAHGS